MSLDSVLGPRGVAPLNQVSERSREIVRNEFEPLSTDVFVVTPPKTGTTFTQMVLHALRGGDMDFDDLYLVSPWLKLAYGEFHFSFVAFRFIHAICMRFCYYPVSHAAICRHRH